MVEEGEDVAPFESFTVEDAGGTKAPSKPEPKQEPAEASQPKEGSDAAPPPPPTPPPRDSIPQATESDSTGGRLETSLDRQLKISPAAVKLALEKWISINSVKGTGSGGQITKSDIEKAKPTASGAGPTAAANYEDIPATNMRKTIASRLTESMQKNPHYYVSSSVSVSKLLKLRQALNSASEGKYRLSVNDFLVKAIAIAARKVPAANSSWLEESGQIIIRQHNQVDISVAVATPVGLITPIVRNVNSLGLESISSQVKDLGKRARDGKLKPDEYQGGTITISNMGMNDAVERFTAVVNPPQACIVAVGTTRKVAMPTAETEDGTIGVEWDDQIVLTSSFDHKVVDGAVGGEFMRELKKVLENPLELML